MVALTELVAWCDTLLGVADYQDYSPNGLQVEGRPEVHTVVSGVSASRALLERAVERNADLVLVHHGWFWRGEDLRVVGMKRRRLALLLAHDISLLAYHLPLDGHAEVGNNARLGELFGINIEGRFGPGPNGGIACFGSLPAPLSAAEFAGRVGQALGREAVLVPGGERPVRRVGWCSGGADGYLEQAAALGLDAYVSGELGEPTVHAAQELGVHYVAAGHHATERYGVQALGAHLAGRFGIRHEYIEVPSPA